MSELGSGNIEIPTPEVVQSNLILVQRDKLFPADSIGHQTFIPQLEGRLRPADIIEARLNQPYQLASPGTKSAERLAADGITTVRDILFLSEEKYKELMRGSHYGLPQAVLKNFNSLITLPHTVLLDSIIPPGYVPSDYRFIPAAQEPAMIHAVNDALATIEPREGDVIRDRYGLETWQPLTRETIARKYGVTRERIRQREALAIRQLARTHRATALLPYASVIERVDEPYFDLQ